MCIMCQNNAGFCRFNLLIMVVNVKTSMWGVKITNVPKQCRILPFYTSQYGCQCVSSFQITNGLKNAGFCHFILLIMIV